MRVDDGNIHLTPGTDVDGPITIVVTDPDLVTEDNRTGEITTEVPVIAGDEGEEPGDGDETEDAVRLDGIPNTLEPTDEEQDSGLTLVDPTEDTTIVIEDEDGELSEDVWYVDEGNRADHHHPGHRRRRAADSDGQ